MAILLVETGADTSGQEQVCDGGSERVEEDCDGWKQQKKGPRVSIMHISLSLRQSKLYLAASKKFGYGEGRKT